MLRRWALAYMGGVHGWANSGHKRSARIAFEALNLQTEIYIKPVMGVAGIDDFVTASVWADTLEEEELGEYHFVHSPFRDCSPYDKNRDCGFNGSGRCLVTGISRYVEVLISETSSAAQKRDASKMLIHLVADMHQPMHTGFAEDVGGTAIALSQPAGLSLHQVWDFYLIEEDLFRVTVVNSDSRKTQKARLLEFWPVDTDVSSVGPQIELWAASIVTEISGQYTCPLAYFDDADWLSSGAALSESYLQSRSVHANNLVHLAGVRTALLLERIQRFVDSRDSKAADAQRAVDALVPRVATSNNPFACLTIDDFDFYPEEIIVACSQTVSAKPNRKKKTAITPDIRNGIDFTQLGLTRFKLPSGKGWVVTSLERIKSRLFERSGDYVAQYDVNFPRNPKRIGQVLNICFDVSIFMNHQDPSFLVEVITHLRNKLPGGKSASSSSSAKTTAVAAITARPSALAGLTYQVHGYPDFLQLLDQKLTSPIHGIEEALTDEQLLVPFSSPAGYPFVYNLLFARVESTEETRARWQAELSLMRRLGEKKFPLEDIAERRLYLWQVFLLDRMGSDIVMLAVGKDKNLRYVTTRAELNANPSYKRANLYDLLLPGYAGATLVMIDVKVLQLTLSYDLFAAIGDYTYKNCHIFDRTGATTYADHFDQVEEVYETLFAIRERRQTAPTRFVNRILTYRRQFDAATTNLAVEWDLKTQRTELANPQATL